MKKHEMKWHDSLAALYGTTIDDHQIEVWQVYLRELETNNDELKEAIEKAVKCDLKPREWRVTVTDLIRWVEALRKKKKADKLDPRSATDQDRIAIFKEKATELLKSGFSKPYLIDEAWGLHGLTDEQIERIVSWIEKLEETK